MDRLRLLVLAAIGGVGFAVGLAIGVGSSAQAQFVPSAPLVCLSPKQTTVLLNTTTAVTVPTTALANRRLLILCNSNENSASAIVKCRIDGTAPVMGLGNAGDALNQGNCVGYNITGATTAQCITGTAGAYVNATECQ